VTKGLGTRPLGQGGPTIPTAKCHAAPYPSALDREEEL
jgi:hypothetical protein